MIFKPNLTILLPPQSQLWPELDTTPEYFTLYGGTALATAPWAPVFCRLRFFFQPAL